jgi:hypothetical protein
MIHMTIKNDKGDREITLSAKNMKELIDNKLPLWLPRLEDDLPLLKQTKRFKANPEKEEARERKSGWYYDV